MSFQFEWDSKKAAKNKRDHGITFGQAITVFDDSGAQEGYDTAHSQEEDRFVRIGLSDTGVLEEKLYYEYQTH